jgi:hypothetical protein
VECGNYYMGSLFHWDHINQRNQKDQTDHKVKDKDLTPKTPDIKDLEEMRRFQDVIRKLSNNKTVGD